MIAHCPPETIVNKKETDRGYYHGFQHQMGQPAKVVITGGLGAAIAKYCTVDAVVDRDLLLDGLRIVYQKNQK